MRKLSEDDKALLDKIASYDNSSLNPVSNIVSEIFLPGETALFISDKAYLLKKENVDLNKVQSKLLCYISLLNELRHEGYIYLLEENDYGPLIIQNNQTNEVWSNQETLFSELGKIEFIDTDTVSVSDEKYSYVGKAFSKDFSNILTHILTSYLCPTEKLKSFKKAGYVTDDEYRYKIKLRHTIIGLIVSIIAVFVSILVPVISTKWQTSYQTDYNNEHAITTIDETQLNKVVSDLNKIATSLDSLNSHIKTIHEHK